MNPVFFTVVIPTYNRSELVKDAISSALEQTFESFEVIVVDDHSTDNTKNVVASFQDFRIKYIVNDRTKGGAGTRNAGIFRAKGDWVAFLDDDDVWLPEKLKLFYDEIKKNRDNVGIVYSGRVEYDFEKKREMAAFLPEKKGSIQNDLLYENHIGTFSGVIIRTDLLKMVGGLDEMFVALQDIELYVRLANLCKVSFIEKKLTYMRNTNEDRISLNYEKKLKGNRLFWNKYKHLINKEPKIRHRAASRVFLFAVLSGNFQEFIKSLHWTFGGIFVDMPNFLWVFKELFYQFREKRRNSM